MESDVKRTVLAAGVVAAALTLACETPAPPAPPPPEVYVTSVIQKDVPEYLDLVGQTEGFQDVDIRARVEGFLETVNFQEGSFVKRGDLLYTIDRKPLEAILAQGKADQATAEARLAKANNDVNRYTPLVAKQAVSKQELDNAVAEKDASTSQVEAAKANVEKASLDLGYTRVTSPITGLVGTTEVKPGNLVGRGESTLLTTISQIDPVLFRVGVTEADYLRVARQVQASGKATGGSREGIELTLADGSRYKHPGKINTVERAVDSTTGTLGVQLVFPNPEQILRPGPIRSRTHSSRYAERRAPRSATGRPGTAEPVQRGRGAGRESRLPQRQGRPARGIALGDRRRPQAWRTGRRRRPSTHTGGHGGFRQASTGDARWQRSGAGR